MRRSTVAHVRHNYLPISESFIYQQLINLQNYRVIFLAKTLENLELFPFKGLYPTQLKHGSWCWFWDKMGYKLFKRELYLENLMRREKVRLIHAHFGNDGVAILPVKKKLNIPLITTFYGYDLSRLPRQEEWRIAYKELFNHGDLFLVEGNNMRKTLIGIGCPSEKARVQHLGINLDRFKFRQRGLNKGKDRIKILFCGRFTEKKGLIYALQALKVVANRHSNLEFRIIGNGELRPEIEDFIAKHNMSKYTTLLGYQPFEVYAEEIHKADILLQPSVTAQDGDSEGGAPIVLLEAQASGLPVVSTCHCDIPEYVIDGKSGFLVPERDSSALAEKLEYLIENPELWARMGSTGREHVERNYDVFKEVRKLEEIYKELEGRYEY